MLVKDFISSFQAERHVLPVLHRFHVTEVVSTLGTGMSSCHREISILRDLYSPYSYAVYFRAEDHHYNQLPKYIYAVSPCEPEASSIDSCP